MKFFTHVYVVMMVFLLGGCAGAGPHRETRPDNSPPDKTVYTVAPVSVAPQPQTAVRRTIYKKCRLDKAGNKTSDCEIVPPGTTVAQTRTSSSVSLGPVPSRGGSNVFKTSEDCQAAWRSGNYTYYVSRYRGAVGKNPADGVTRKVAPLEADACVDLDAVHGPAWVVQKKGEKYRFNANPDGSLGAIYARDDCGNTARRMVLLLAEMDVGQSEETRYAIVQEEIWEIPPQPQQVVGTPARGTVIWNQTINVTEQREYSGGGSSGISVGGCFGGPCGYGYQQAYGMSYGGGLVYGPNIVTQSPNIYFFPGGTVGNPPVIGGGPPIIGPPVIRGGGPPIIGGGGIPPGGGLPRVR